MTQGSKFFTFCFWMSSILVVAQTQHFQFERINQLEGASIGQVNFITEDDNGHIWFSEESNNALTRFDGFSVKRYQHDPENTNSLGGFYPECIYIDKDGIIWIGFFGQGLDRFDPATERFTHYYHSPDQDNGLSNNSISDIIEGPDGKIYIATFAGLDILDPETGVFRNFAHDPEDLTTISSNIVRELYMDPEGTVWVGTGWFFAEGDQGGLNRFEVENGTFQRYLADRGNPKALQNQRVTSIFQDSKGRFWVGTGGDGLHLMDKSKGTFTHFPFDADNPQLISIPAYEGQTYGVTFITEDNRGNLWIGGNGVDVYNLENNSFHHFGNNRDFDGTYIENSSWCIHMARNGLVWLSTQPGVYKIDPYKFVMPLTASGVPILYNDTDSISWTMDNQGLLRENFMNGKHTYWSYKSIGMDLGMDSITQCLYEDGHRRLWIGTNQGIYSLNLSKDETKIHVQNVPDRTTTNHHFITAVLEDSEGRIWASSRDGLFLFDESAEVFDLFDLDALTDHRTSIPWNITFLSEGDENELWIGHRIGGNIYKLEFSKDSDHKLTQYLLGNGQYDMIKDRSDDLWVASQTGLHRYNRLEDQFDNIINYSVYALAEDLKGNIWVNTINQIYRISNRGETVIEIEIEQSDVGGHLFVPPTSKGMNLPDGSVILGDDRKHYLFHPDSIFLPMDTSILIFTGLWISQRSERKGEIRTDYVPLTGRDEVALSFTQNSFSLSVTEIDYRSSSRNIISYRLDDYDLSWNETFSEDRISYSNLPPGDYQLDIRAVNSTSGLVANKSLRILVAPPWYRTVIAYVIYVVLFLSTMLVLDRIRRKRILEKERARSREKELAQAREIERAYTELKTTQAQLIQSEKMASLGELTAGIAHEIQNPLNFVNNFAEINRELVGELKEALADDDFEEIQLILADLAANESKVAHHGRRAEQIIKSMLQHSRASTGVEELTDLNALCDEYVRLAYHGIRARDKAFQAQFELNLDPDLPQLEVVPQDIGRVVLNLVNNAFQAVAAKEDGKVIISTHHDSQGISICVKDDGPGIADEIKNKIFQPFFTTKPTGQGTGLGLSMSYDIVTKGHGGTLKAKSKLGQGSEFTIFLPV